MRLLSNIVRSWKKSRRLRALQLKIASGRDDTLEDFLDLCVEDANVAGVMKNYNLSRDSLKELYRQLRAVGLGQWVKGHFVALSTLAYYEPLLYAVESRRRVKENPEKAADAWIDEVSTLLDYWEGKIPQGKLLDRLR